MLNTLKQILKDEAGANAIEFAILAPTLFLLVFGTLEFAVIFYTSSVIETATNKVARYGVTDNDYAGGTGVPIWNKNGLTREEFLREEIIKQTFGILQPTHINVDTTVYSNITNALNNNPETAVSEFGDGNEVVLYRVSYSWSLLTPIISSIIGNDEGNFEIASALIAKNEDF